MLCPDCGEIIEFNRSNPNDGSLRTSNEDTTSSHIQKSAAALPPERMAYLTDFGVPDANKLNDPNHPWRHERATPKQVAYLTYIGVSNADQLSKLEACELIDANPLLSEANSPTERDRLRAYQNKWHTERLILYPDAYAIELKEFLRDELPKSLHNYVRKRVVGAAENLTKAKIRHVVDNLTGEDARWWHQPDHQAVFFERLRQMYPGCCDDRNQIQHVHGLGGSASAELTHTETGVQIKTNHFAIVELQQGTPEWGEWRHNGIGASDASTIMGENRFKNIAQLLQEKRGPTQDYGQNAAMSRGTELEPQARRLYVAKTGKDVRPACLQSTRYDWLRASLDGLAINQDAVVEIKCGQSAYRTASQTRSVPVYYYGQTQHILAVTGFDSLDFWCYWPGYPELLIVVPRNVVYIERLLSRELEFWNLVQKRLIVP